MFDMKKTLLVIPHYNDSIRLRPFLNQLVEILPSHFSILVSDDGSEESEVHALVGLIAEVRATLPPQRASLLDPLLFRPNTGKGGAVIRGWEQGKGFDLISFVDADGAVSAGEIVRGEQLMRSPIAPDALFGSRVKMLGRRILRSRLRHVTGRVFSTLVSVVSGLPAYDTQCGLKILKYETFCKIRPYMKSVGFAFDVELCLLLLKFGYRVEEFPLDWEDVAGSKVRLLRDSIRMGMEVFRIRRRIADISL